MVLGSSPVKVIALLLTLLITIAIYNEKQTKYIQVMLSFSANFAIFALKAENTEYLPALKIAVPWRTIFFRFFPLKTCTVVNTASDFK